MASSSKEESDYIRAKLCDMIFKLADEIRVLEERRDFLQKLLSCEGQYAQEKQWI
jgi:hypothetical protein